MPRTRILLCFLSQTSLDVTDSVHLAVGTQIMKDILSTFSLPGDVDANTTVPPDNFTDLPVDQKKIFDTACKQWKSQYHQSTEEILKIHHEGLTEEHRPDVNAMHNFFKDGIIQITVCPTKFNDKLDEVFAAYLDD